MRHNWQRKRVLVTGGAGLIGSHLCEALLDKGCEVICVDNYYSGNKDNIAHLKTNPYFEEVRHDIIRPLDAEVDEIYNLACPAAPNHYQKDAVRTIRTSVEGSINMLNLAKLHNAKILQTSTSEVYGDPTVHPQPESYWGNVNPIGIRACYDEGKRCAEALFFDYHRQHGVEIRIARVFNTYGPNSHPNDGRVIPNFIMQALRGDPLTLYGNGQQSRSFCYVTDMVEGLIRLMENTPNGYTGPVNLGNPNEFTMRELAETVLKLTNSKSVIEQRSLPQDDPKQRQPDIAVALRDLNWQPTVSLEEGLRPTIAYFEEVLSYENRHQHSDFSPSGRAATVA